VHSVEMQTHACVSKLKLRQVVGKCDCSLFCPRRWSVIKKTEKTVLFPTLAVYVMSVWVSKLIWKPVWTSRDQDQDLHRLDSNALDNQDLGLKTSRPVWGVKAKAFTNLYLGLQNSDSFCVLSRPLNFSGVPERSRKNLKLRWCIDT